MTKIFEKIIECWLFHKISYKRQNLWATCKKSISFVKIFLQIIAKIFVFAKIVKKIFAFAKMCKTRSKFSRQCKNMDDFCENFAIFIKIYEISYFAKIWKDSGSKLYSVERIGKSFDKKLFWLTGMDMTMPECDDDGMWAPVQCSYTGVCRLASQ